ncbi:MAG: CAP domain-containing protein, partial [Clostridiales bacterium]|nr:CAP domain-containing protein [Clostridiales bacterium]
MRKKVLLFLTVMMIWLYAVPAFAVQVLPTDVDKASDGCVLVGIEGQYLVDIQNALDRINEIRKEACEEGVINPSSDSKARLTMADYVPIKWSSDLEYIARIRAAESSLTMDHVRTNGSSCFAIVGPNGKKSWGEVIAWNNTTSVIKGINQWYGEKQDWVDQNSNAVTGHYTSMIDPENLYVGLGTFYSYVPEYRNTTVGEFSFQSGLDESQGTAVSDCIQTLEVSQSNLTGKYEISGVNSGKAGDQIQLSLTTGVSYEDYWGDPLTTDGIVVLDSCSWSS